MLIQDLVYNWNCRDDCSSRLNRYVIVNIVENPESTPPGIEEMAIAIEVFQVSYVIITGIIIARRG
jgi:hypothetical protein